MEIKLVTVESGGCKCGGGLTAKQKGGNWGRAKVFYVLIGVVFTWCIHLSKPTKLNS